MIPNIIHQSWKTTDLSSYGPSAKKSRNSWQKIYPDFEYKFWTDMGIADYIQKQPQIYQQAFNDLDQNIKKMDFFRYLALYEYGGIYSDMDFITDKRIEKNILSNYSFIGYKACRNHRDHYLEDGDGAFSDKSYTINDGDGKWVLGQAFFGCERGHKGIGALIKDIISNKNLKHPPLHHTGPEKINKLFIENNLLRCDSTFIFSKQEIDNCSGSIGYHLRDHRWV
jgi:mannosyltransferase OCH1-like enzyme